MCIYMFFFFIFIYHSLHERDCGIFVSFSVCIVYDGCNAKRTVFLSKYSKCPNVVTAKNLKIDMILPEKESISQPLKEDAKQKCSCVKKNGD